MFQKYQSDHYQILILLVFSLIYGTWWWQTPSWILLIGFGLFFGFYFLLKLSFKVYCPTILFGFMVTWIISQSWSNNNHFWLTQWWNGHNRLQQFLISFINRNYSSPGNDLINQLLFNQKNWHSWFYQELKQLSLLHLLVISGLHISLIYQTITKLAGKHQRIVHWMTLIFFLVYWIAIDFSYPAFRAILSLFLGYQLKQRSSLVVWAYTTLFSLLFNPLIYGSMTFILSAGVSLIISLIHNYCTQSEIIKWTWINVMISTYVTLILLPKTYRFYPFMILNNLILSPVIIVLYCYLMITWFIIGLIPITNTILNGFGWLINNLSVNKIHLRFNFWTISHSQITMFLLIMMGFLVYYWLTNNHYNNWVIRKQQVW